MAKAAGVIAGSVLLAAAIAWAGSDGGVTIAGVSVFALCAAISFAVNWLAFVPAYAAKTERYYDLTGSLTYLSLIVCGMLLAAPDARGRLLAGMVAVWALRLGSFLFLRIRRDGKDRRFDEVRADFARFLTAWTLQALWVFLTVCCALAAITSAAPRPLGPWAVVGGLVWLAGFAIEAVADRQKRLFRGDPANRGRFITSGLWSWSRHPNYCGEIVLWTGVALVALPALSGWQFATLISPVFVYLLLTRVSGVPLLEERADAKWGGEPEYEAYKARTSELWLRPPASA